jgi:hypothetical protein
MLTRRSGPVSEEVQVTWGSTELHNGELALFVRTITMRDKTNEASVAGLN